MVCLINENKDNIKPRPDLMNPKFPSIWCEEVREFEKKTFLPAVSTVKLVQFNSRPLKYSAVRLKKLVKKTRI